MVAYESKLKEGGLKVTPQRAMILKELRNSGHLSIEELYNAIKPQYASMSLATVYKNIDSLKDAGIIAEVYVPSGKNKYELKQMSHAHFFCTECGMLSDIDMDGESLLSLYQGNHKIEGFSVVFSGTCEVCKEGGA